MVNKITLHDLHPKPQKSTSIFVLDFLSGASYLDSAGLLECSLLFDILRLTFHLNNINTFQFVTYLTHPISITVLREIIILSFDSCKNHVHTLYRKGQCFATKHQEMPVVNTRLCTATTEHKTCSHQTEAR